jgi:hypothetical protein
MPREKAFARRLSKPRPRKILLFLTIIDALVDLPSPALKACLAATESALAAVKSEREEATKRLETAKVEHRDLLNSQDAYSRLAGTRNIETRSKLRLEIRLQVERITF